LVFYFASPHQNAAKAAQIWSKLAAGESLSTQEQTCTFHIQEVNAAKVIRNEQDNGSFNERHQIHIKAGLILTCD
jgi:hypothetical protein